MPHQLEITAYGARPDGRTLNTAAIQQAIDDCHAAGGGVVACGPGDFLTGSLELKSRVELRLEAGCRLVASPRLEDYPPFDLPGFRAGQAPEKSRLALIRACEGENIALAGPGTVHGNGFAFYEKIEGPGKLPKPPTPRPRLVMFYRCRDIRIESVAFVDSPCWTIWLMQCAGGRVNGIRVSGDRRLRNVDGIDIDACRDITVSDCRMDTEDDCVVLRNMEHLYGEPGACENITVANCVLKSSFQGVRVGCPGDGKIRNCAFSNLVIESRGNGIIFQNPHRYLPPGSAGGAGVEDISFSNVLINCRRHPVWIIVEEGIALERLAGISFSNLRAKSGGPCLVQGCPETIIENILFSDIDIETDGEEAIICRHCRDIRLSGVKLSNRAPGLASPGVNAGKDNKT